MAKLPQKAPVVVVGAPPQGAPAKLPTRPKVKKVAPLPAPQNPAAGSAAPQPEPDQPGIGQSNIPSRSSGGRSYGGRSY